MTACKTLLDDNILSEEEVALYTMSGKIRFLQLDISQYFVSKIHFVIVLECFLVYCAVLDQQMTKGILQTSDARKYTLCYHREWRNIINHPNSEGISEYVDCKMQGGVEGIDFQMHSFVRDLSQKLIDHLGNASCKQYFIPWTETGNLVKSTPVYTEYLNKLCCDFIDDVKYLILQGVREARKMRQTIASELTKEVLHHAKIARRNLCNCEVLDEAALRHVESFLHNSQLNSKLFVLYGPAGCGKTTLMADIGQRITGWFHEDCIVVSRFLCSTAESSNIHSIVLSITNQICLAYGINTPDQDKQEFHMSTLFGALTVFRDTLNWVSLNYGAVRPLFILLDGINLLHPIDESLHSLWALQSFPSNVYMIVSTATEIGSMDIVGPLSAIVTENECCKKISDLSEEQTKYMIAYYCKQIHIDINDRDVRYVMNAAYNTKNILHLKLLCNQLKVTNFDDSSTVAEEELDRSAREVFKQIIRSFENRFGPLLVKYTLSFITLSPGGIAEGFLVDLITNDYSVMLEQDFFHNVPPEKTLLLSPRVWAELKQELSPYLEEGHAYGQTLLKWRHQEYSTAVSEIYGVIFPGMQVQFVTLNGTEFTLSLHKCIVDFYVSGDQVKHGVDGHQLLVTPQVTNKANIAKLMRLSIHTNILLPVEGLDRMKSNMHFNLEWIRTKMEHVSAHTVMQDVYSATQLVTHFRNEKVLELEDSYGSLSDLDLMFEFWQLALPAIEQDGCLYIEILGRLTGSAKQWPHIKQLVESVTKKIEFDQKPILFPVFPCLKTPGNINKHSIYGPTDFVECVHNGSVAVMFSQKFGVDLWRLDAAELLHRFHVNREQSVKGVLVTSSGDFILICHYSHLTHRMEMGVWSTHTGVEVIHSTFMNKFEALVLDPEDQLLFVSTVVDVDMMTDQVNR